MSSDVQREAMAMLAEVWSLSPDVRFGQLVAHLGFLAEAHYGRGLGDIEDDELMSVLSLHRAELLARLQNGQELVPQPGPGPSIVSQSSTVSSGSVDP